MDLVVLTVVTLCNQAGISNDQTVMESLIAGATQQSFDDGKKVYTMGGNSKTIATLQVTGGLPQAVKAKTKLTATGVDGRSVVGIAAKDAAANSNLLLFQYPVTTDYENYLDCRVGGLPENERITEGCKYFEINASSPPMPRYNLIL